MNIDDCIVKLSNVLSLFSLDDVWTSFALRFGAAQTVRTELRERVSVHSELPHTAPRVDIVHDALLSPAHF